MIANNQEKRKRKNISLAQKVVVLDRLKFGESISSVSRDLDLKDSTIRTIKANEDKIRDSVLFKSSQVITKYSRIKNVLSSKMEDLLIVWIEECNKNNIQLSTQIIKEKSLEILQMLNQDSSSEVSFKASNGWFDKFKTRFSLHNIKIQEEKALTDKKTANTFTTNLAEQVPSAVETDNFREEMPDMKYISANDYCELNLVEDDEGDPIDPSNVDTIMKMSKALENYVLKNDPNPERSNQFSRELNEILKPYRSIHQQNFGDRTPIYVNNDHSTDSPFFTKKTYINLTTSSDDSD